MCFRRRLRAAFLAAAILALSLFSGSSAFAEAYANARLEDYQYILSSSEKSELLSTIKETADTIGMNVGVVLSDDLGGKSEQKYTEDFLRESFGWDSDSIVLMLVRSGTGNQDMITTAQLADSVYAPQRQEIFDAMYVGLDSGYGDNYPAAIEEFCKYLVNHQNGAGVDAETVAYWVIGAAVMIGLGFIISGIYASRYKKRAPLSAVGYMDKKNSRITGRSTIFVREYTTSHTTDSHRGGGHHGGGGGGGHSSGGGRHR